MVWRSGRGETKGYIYSSAFLSMPKSLRQLVAELNRIEKDYEGQGVHLIVTIDGGMLLIQKVVEVGTVEIPND